ncbi:hypothetical protein JKP88DRAFT_250364 [Tribonema minus]|uniref:Uncharacterized protein n=1 Tax=Tribonema minus TaxID=303371 RepID=A0A835YIH8_9STRA|nr:hypothetical protein JKP88DRAFT_250364 [Tribonema minus]
MLSRPLCSSCWRYGNRPDRPLVHAPEEIRRRCAEVVREVGESRERAVPGQGAHKAKRSAFIKRKVVGKAPPKILAPLPMAQPGAAFIRIDKAAMKSHFPALDVRSGPWGYLSYLDPYSKSANIRCLRNSSWGRGKLSFLSAVQDRSVTKCPWLLAPTFETDGRQIKLAMMSSEGTRPSHHGLSTLHKSGYQLGKDVVSLEAVVNGGAGAYNMRFVTPDERIDDLYIGAVNPATIKPVQAMFTTGDNWVEARLPEAVGRTGTRFKYYEVTEKDIAKGSRLYKSTTMRTSRGRTGHRTATPSKNFRKRTSVTAEFLRYCGAWRAVEDAYWREILRPTQRIKRFLRFSLVQSQAECIAKGLCKRIRSAGRGCWCSETATSTPRRGIYPFPRRRNITFDRDDGGSDGIAMKFVRYMRCQPDINQRRRRGG